MPGLIWKANISGYIQLLFPTPCCLYDGSRDGGKAIRSRQHQLLGLAQCRHCSTSFHPKHHPTLQPLHPHSYLQEVAGVGQQEQRAFEMEDSFQH